MVVYELRIAKFYFHGNDMKPLFDPHDKKRDAEEEHLAELIKQAGDEARAQKKDALARHFKKIQSVITETLSSQRGGL